MSTIIYKGKSFERADLEAMSTAALVNLHNKLTDKVVTRFSARSVGVLRTWKLLETHGEASKAAAAAPAQAKAQGQVKKAGRAAPAKKTATPRKRRGTHLLPSGEPVEACRAGSKQAILVDILARKQGATMPELLEALSGGRKPWKEATVRSGFGWDLKRKGYGVRSRFDADGTERFHLLVPEGERIPGHIAASKPASSKATPPKITAKRAASRATAPAPQVAASK